MLEYFIQRNVTKVNKQGLLELYIPYQKKQRSAIVLSFLNSEYEDYNSYLNKEEYIDILNQRYIQEQSDIAPYHFFVTEEKSGCRIYQNKNTDLSVRFKTNLSPYNNDLSVMICEDTFSDVSSNLFYQVSNLIALISHKYGILIDSIILNTAESSKYEDFLNKLKKCSIFIRNKIEPVFSAKEAVEVLQNTPCTLEQNTMIFDTEKYKSAASVSLINLSKDLFFITEGQNILCNGIDYVLEHDSFNNKTNIFFVENKNISSLSAFTTTEKDMYIIKNESVMLFKTSRSELAYNQFLTRLPIKEGDFKSMNLHIYKLENGEFVVKNYSDVVLCPSDIEPTPDYTLMNAVKNTESNYLKLKQML